MVVSDSALHRSPSVVMLNPKSNIGCQSPIIFWDCAFNLKPQIASYSKVEHTVSDEGKAQKNLIKYWSWLSNVFCVWGVGGLHQEYRKHPEQVKQRETEEPPWASETAGNSLPDLKELWWFYHLDLPEWNEQALLQLGVEAQQLSCLLEVPAGCCQCIHPVRRNFPSETHLKLNLEAQWNEQEPKRPNYKS